MNQQDPPELGEREEAGKAEGGPHLCALSASLPASLVITKTVSVSPSFVCAVAPSLSGFFQSWCFLCFLSLSLSYSLFCSVPRLCILSLTLTSFFFF